jgi:hypothetical protein
MLKISKKPGKNTSDIIEIQNISNQGIWIFVQDKEYFIPFNKFPWFLKATIQQIYNLEFFHGNHLHWPDLDVDIELESLKSPDSYPLQYS